MLNELEGRLLLGGVLLAVLFLTGLKYRSWGIYLIIVGGVSNFLERFFHGRVNDYWRVGSLEFNLADILIMVGVGVVIYSAVYARSSALGRAARHRSDSR